MKAFVASSYGSYSNLEEKKVDKPSASGRDLLVQVRAVATNPVDLKKLANWGHVDAKMERPLVIGWDCAGVVEAVGSDVVNFRVGDEVYFAGSLGKDGCFADYVVVDERVTGRKPANLSFEEAAALPLTTVTAWEGMVSMGIQRNSSGKVILINPGAGGVGSIAIQLAKKVFGLTVVATASRSDSQDYCRAMGADYVINHSEPLQPQLRDLGISGIDYAYRTADLTQECMVEYAAIMNPLGSICFITAHGKVDIGILMSKSLRLCAELMATKPLFGVELQSQGDVLNETCRLVEGGVIKSTKNVEFPFTLDGLKSALELQESGKAIGKICLVNR